jgi:hypothetical protein
MIDATAGAVQHNIHQVRMMNPMHYYHTPIKPISTRASCPVCHETVYSRAGIHPQCAIIQSDPPKMKSKKQQARALLDDANTASDHPGADVVVEPPNVGPSPVGEQPIVPTTPDVGRVGQDRLVRGKGAWARYIR